MKKYRLIVSKNQEQKLDDWTYIVQNGVVKYIPVKWKESAAARFMEEEEKASSQPEGRETA